MLPTSIGLIDWEALRQKYLKIYKEYSQSFESLEEAVSNSVKRKEYSKGGLTVHRGFYYPGALDLVAAGCNRGRLYKKLPKKPTYDYEYYFDGEDRMICCKKYGTKKDSNRILSNIEYLIYTADKVLGLVFSMGSSVDRNYLSVITESLYSDSQLERYENVLFLPTGKQSAECTEINIETFEYSEKGIEALLWQRYTSQIKLLTKERFNFKRDFEGNLITYTVETNDNNNCLSVGESVFREYKVLGGYKKNSLSRIR